MKKTNEKSVSQQSVETGIAIIKMATEIKEVSLGQAALLSGKSRNYIPQIKLTIDERYIKGNINRSLYREFNSTLRTYNKVKASK